MEPFKKKTMRQLSCFHDQPDLLSGLTTRKGGYSEAPFDTLNMGLHVSDHADTVIDNRKRLVEELNIPLENWVIGEQVHDTEVKIVDHRHAGAGAFSQEKAIAGIDGLLTDEPGLVLAAFYADCVPLYFYDSTSHWVGIAHAGWKGTVGGMAGKMVDAFVQQGCTERDIQLAIGPSIGINRYEVDQKVIDQIPHGYHNECVVKKEKGKYQLDLKALNRRIAKEKGILDENIQVSGYCTYEEDHLFYSHRRDHGKTGRMLGFIGLRN